MLPPLPRAARRMPPPFASAFSKSAEGISRQPEAADKIRAGMMLGLVFIETAIIYALIVAILIIFVL